MEIKELGHAVLYVSDLERSRHFYRDVLGFREVSYAPPTVAFSSGRTHHELLLIEVGKGASRPAGHRLGLYHLGFKVGDSDDQLREALATLRDNDVEIVGASDHLVTHSLYLKDPDGNELELYVDVDDSWKKDPAAISSPIRPLRL